MHGELGKYYWWPNMRKDIVDWCRACLTCATRQTSRKTKPPLVPIPVGGPWDRVGVDIVQLPKSHRGNQYAIVFCDYLTKWPEVFPTKDQTALTVAQLLVREVIPRHGIPRQLLSDRGSAFLSKLMMEIYKLLGVKKVNTTAYHPQCDSLVERFNRSLIDMLSKTVQTHGQDWDEKLPFVLFAYRASIQQSILESPFYLMYGRDPQLPTDAILVPEPDRKYVEVQDFRSEMVMGISQAWKLARENIEQAQKYQKSQHDKHAKDPNFKLGDRVFVHMPAEKRGKAYKFARTFHGPYRVVELLENGVRVVPVDKPQESPIRVALNRVRCCPVQLPNEFWPRRNNDKSKPTTAQGDTSPCEQIPPRSKAVEEAP